MEKPTERPEVIVVPHRAGRMPRGIAVPIVLLAMATIGLTIRAMSPDWRGLSQEVNRRMGSLFASRPTMKGKEAKAAPQLAHAVKPTPKATVPAEKAPAPKPEVPAPAKTDAWDDIKRDAEKAQAERDEAEKIKEKASEDLAKTPPPPSFARRGRVIAGRDAFAQLQRLQAEMMRRMEAEMGAEMDEHDRIFDEMLQRHGEMSRKAFEDLARNRPGWFGNIPPGFGDFDRPLPGMDRMNAPLPGMDRANPPRPGQPRIFEDSGEDVRNGVKRTWRTRTIIIGGR